MSALNFVELLDADGRSVYKSNLTEPILTPEEDKTDVVPPFNAYSPPGNLTVKNFPFSDDCFMEHKMQVHVP